MMIYELNTEMYEHASDGQTDTQPDMRKSGQPRIRAQVD